MVKLKNGCPNYNKTIPVTLNVYVYAGQMRRYSEFLPFGVNPAT